MKKQTITLLLLLISVSSCTAQKREIISKSTIKLERENINIRDFIEIDGYYQSLDSTLLNGMMFFEDGTCVCRFWFKEGATKDMKKANLSQAIYSWKQKKQIRWGDCWGVYRIDKDTIVIQDFVKYGFFSSEWYFYETKYEIINRRTLKLVYMKSLLKDDEEKNRNKHPYGISQKNLIDEFVSADSLPSSDCWLKEEKWIWRHESDWKAYMEKIKQKKANKK